MCMNWKKWFRKSRNEWPRGMEYAFTCNGKDYYTWDDINAIPALRALMAYTVTNELTMRVDREYLLEFTKAIDAIINGPAVKKTELSQLNIHLKERLNFIVETELLYKLASIVFIDMNEDAYEYDMAYGQKKINEWKSENINVFFSKLRIDKLINYKGLSDIDLQSYSKITEAIKEVHLEYLSELQSNSNSTTSSVK